MTNEMLERMEAHITRLDGNLTHVKRVLLLSKLIAEKENMPYGEDILAFVAYFHDIAAYPTYAASYKGSFDHALESSKLAPDLAKEYGYDNNQIEIIVEAVKYHDKAGMGEHNETRLIRNADGIDYIGYMAVARDFVKFPKDMRKAMEMVRQRKVTFGSLIDLDYAKSLAAPRIRELDNFIERFEEESFGIY
ncbi:MAG: HD domain-containing protein [Oscillospiraceae bacterium]|nr:HD domain-containing protein [Oscillospiraceae bacterium]